MRAVNTFSTLAALLFAAPAAHAATLTLEFDNLWDVQDEQGFEASIDCFYTLCGPRIELTQEGAPEITVRTVGPRFDLVGINGFEASQNAVRLPSPSDFTIETDDLGAYLGMPVEGMAASYQNVEITGWRDGAQVARLLIDSTTDRAADSDGALRLGPAFRDLTAFSIRLPEPPGGTRFWPESVYDLLTSERSAAWSCGAFTYSCASAAFDSFTVSVPVVSAIPLPPAAGLLATALGALALTRRRRTA